MRRLLLSAIAILSLSAPVAGAQRIPPPAVTPDGHTVVVVVNIPASVLTLYVDSLPVASYPVSPGRVKYETPTGVYAIHSVIWNPDWRPPDSDWASDRDYTAPGPNNPMGRVKLPINDEALYIHGSPEVNSIGRPASHGCIRLKNADAMALARRIVGLTSPGVDSSRIDAVLANSKRTTVMKLGTAVQVRVLYAVAQVVGDSLWVYPDPYRGTRVVDTRARIGSHKPRAHMPTRTDEAIATLRSAGVSEASIDSVGLAAMEDASKGRLFVVPIRGGFGSPRAAATKRNVPGQSAPIRSVYDLLKQPN